MWHRNELSFSCNSCGCSLFLTKDQQFKERMGVLRSIWDGSACWAGLILVLVRENPQHFFLILWLLGQLLYLVSPHLFSFKSWALRYLAGKIACHRKSGVCVWGGEIKPVTWFVLTIIIDMHSLGTERTITVHFSTLYIYILHCNLNLEGNKPCAD